MCSAVTAVKALEKKALAGKAKSDLSIAADNEASVIEAKAGVLIRAESPKAGVVSENGK